MTKTIILQAYLLGKGADGWLHERRLLILETVVYKRLLYRTLRHNGTECQDELKRRFYLMIHEYAFQILLNRKICSCK